MNARAIRAVNHSHSGQVFSESSWPGRPSLAAKPLAEQFVLQSCVCLQREVRNCLATALVMIIFSVFFWQFGHHETQANPEYWVVVKVCPALPGSHTTPVMRL